MDDFKVYIPHPYSYLKTVARLKLKPAEAMFVPAYGWEVTSAAHAGLQTDLYCPSRTGNLSDGSGPPNRKTLT
jgi:FMN phosphatase YigB (HAD superfamily)